MGRPFRSLQQLINIIEVDAGPGVQGLRPNLERPRRFDESRTDRGPKRVVHRLFQRAPASVGGLLDLRGNVFIERDGDSYSHTKILEEECRSVKGISASLPLPQPAPPVKANQGQRAVGASLLTFPEVLAEPVRQGLPHAFPADPLLDPPVGVIGFVDIFDRPAEAGEVLEPLVLHGFTNTVVRHDLDRAAGKTVAAHGEIMPDETLGTPLISYLNSSSASTVAFLMQSGTE